jgi:hypothetical protein
VPDDDDDTKPDPTEKKYTEADLQRHLNRVGSQEKKDGRRIREAEILDELGVTSLDEIKDLVTKLKSEEDSRKSELDKEREAAAKDREAAKAEREAARQERHQAAAERALLAAGLSFPKDAKDEERTKIINRALRSLDLETANGEPDQATIVKAVEDLKSDVPSFFAEQKPKGDPQPVHGDPGGPPGKIPQSDAAAQAKAQLHRLHPELATKDS